MFSARRKGYMKQTSYGVPFQGSPDQRGILKATFPSMSNIPGFIMKILRIVGVMLALVIGYAALTARADEVKVIAGDGATGKDFGRSVSISGDYAIVGAVVDDHKGSAYMYIVHGPPSVLSITRADADPTNASSVNFTVTFSQSVGGVDTSDFSLTMIGISGASVTSVSGSGSTYTVTVNTGTGDGTLGLNLVDNDTITNIAPLGGSGAGNGNFTGETYTIDKTKPGVSSVTPNLMTIADANVGDKTFTLTIDYDESMNKGVAPTISFPTENPGNTLIFDSGEWPDSDTYVARYDAFDVDQSISDMDVRVTGGQDTAGNTQTQADSAGAFSIDTENPNVSVSSPSVSDTSTGPVTDSVYIVEQIPST